MKEFVIEESGRCGVTPSAIYIRLARGKYPQLQRHYINQRVVLVKEAAV